MPVNYKKGQPLFYVYSDDETGKTELWIYIIRSIRSGFVHSIKYEKGITWVKLSTKHGDFGWSKNIWSLYRKKTPIGKDFDHLFTTKLRAWKECLKETMKTEIEYFEPGAREKIIKTCKTMISRNKPKGAKKKMDELCDECCFDYPNCDCKDVYIHEGLIVKCGCFKKIKNEEE